MKTYKLGNLGDRVLTVKKRDGQHVATLRIKNVDMKYVELPPKRWAAFRQVVGEVNEAANGAEGIKLQLHIGGAYYISATSGIRCVDFANFTSTSVRKTAR